jgi:hypothetical protein
VGTAATPVELYSAVDSAHFTAYFSPLAHAFGAAASCGLYRSAAVGRFPSVEFGIQSVTVRIPAHASTFDAIVFACSANTKLRRLDTFYVLQPNAATILGDPGPEPIHELPEDALSVPAHLPGGLGTDALTLLVPEASLCLPVPGAELSLRYVPWPLFGTTLHLAGIALREELTDVSGLGLPLDFAVMGFYQAGFLGPGCRFRTLGANIHASRRFDIIEPYAGIGIDNTTSEVTYDFHYDAPTGYDTLSRRIITQPVTRHLRHSLQTGTTVRMAVGLGLFFGPLIVSADYTFSGFHVLSAGLSFRPF